MGRLYVHNEKDDVVVLVDPAPDAYQEKGRFTLPNQPDRGRAQAWAYPVVANGRLYLRDLDSLWCYDVKAPVTRRAYHDSRRAARQVASRAEIPRPKNVRSHEHVTSRFEPRQTRATD